MRQKRTNAARSRRQPDDLSKLKSSPAAYDLIGDFLNLMEFTFVDTDENPDCEEVKEKAEAALSWLRQN